MAFSLPLPSSFLKLLNDDDKNDDVDDDDDDDDDDGESRFIQDPATQFSGLLDHATHQASLAVTLTLRFSSTDLDLVLDEYNTCIRLNKYPKKEYF